MKLNHRILLLIAPVILFSAAASSYIIYVTQKDALIKRTDSYLQLNMEKLAGYYRQTNTLVSSYAYTLAKSDIIRHYFFHEQNPFRELELVDNLHETIHTLQPKQKQFVALSILNGQRKVLYYAERSNDPFAQMDPKLLRYIGQIYQQTKKTAYVGYTENSSGEGVLLRYDVLDTKTLETPLSYNQDEIFFVVVYATLNRFNVLKKNLEFDNKTTIFFTGKPPEKEGLSQTVELQSGLSATLDPAPFILNHQLNSIQKELIFAFGISAFFTVLLLLLLLYKHVINPISRLDNQLQEVENNERKNIEVLPTNDEIGRLSSRFYVMYTELEKTYQQTKVLAENDHLTNLANRHQFQRHAKTILSQTHTHVWALYIDLDNFKYVNDKYGHQIGDSLLINFANHVKTLCQYFNQTYQIHSLASRLSGDEFAILLQSSTEQPGIEDEFAQKLLEPIQNRTHSPMGNFPITASIGIATFPEDGQHIEKLLSNADTAMYQAKNAGKNQIAHYSRELDKIVQRRANIERALRAGSFDHEFSLVYQPYFTCSGKAVSGFEVLLRWESAHLGDISPDEFIPIAEQTGLFGEIDRWVIRKAFEEFSRVQEIQTEPKKIAINLSSAELDSMQLAEYIEELAITYRIPVHLIEFEITETFAAESQSFPLLHELSKLGFGLTIDDFGSGYTSISQLVQYPVQKIKLDRQFLDTLIASQKHQVVKPLIDLCHSQNMKVTAEGIETESMHQWLSDYQCDYLQGYYFGKPMTVAELKNWKYNQEESDNEPNYRSIAQPS
ncbi:putative bifunctional diguanylate cyclase/phosphodiesterase [Vibrio mangrovi]|uniref:Cyclic di-GMP phosphodiesterase Gmr n=1 Tax=Vibrio mangrovi TaxID=474394 RepID=A0A1Y6IZD1_9VIBR|nr:EAL domain-containing protein [Vibrio mangrovi]MDW6003150.1 EAL domain-containing protein [Vibrio mangrovi]SMS01393.1 Cyclic di-GMP phosphodiesterase Gmr [Vibrio mangrovi]